MSHALESHYPALYKAVCILGGIFLAREIVGSLLIARYGFPEFYPLIHPVDIVLSYAYVLVPSLCLTCQARLLSHGEKMGRLTKALLTILWFLVLVWFIYGTWHSFVVPFTVTPTLDYLSEQLPIIGLLATALPFGPPLLLAAFFTHQALCERSEEALTSE